MLSRLAIVAALMLASGSHAAQLGHSRLVSQAGQPLLIEIPVSQLSASEADTLQATPAQESVWRAAGLTPPVPLSSLRFELVPAPSGRDHVLRVRSAEVFNQPVADLLLDIHSAAGEQRFQVSLLAQSDPAVVRAPVVAPVVSGAAPAAGGAAIAAGPIASTITVRPGDTMFAIARRHAVAGISEYQLMMALLRANPQAFINDNVNLVLAGARLTMPDSSALAALSDRAARRLFHQHVVAFEQRRHVAALDGVGDEPQAIDTGDTILQAIDPEPEPSAPAEEEPLHEIVDEPAPVVPDTVSSSRPEPEGAMPPTPDTEADEAVDVLPSVEPAASAPEAETEAGTESTESAEEPVTPAAPDTVSRTQDQLRLSSVTPVGQADAVTHDETLTSTTATRAVTTASGSETPEGTPSQVPGNASAALGVLSDANAGQPPAEQGRSAGQGDDVIDDDEVAKAKAIAEAQERISQLEENVKNLNRALQSQGEAAKDLVLESAHELRQSLSEVATAVGEVATAVSEAVGLDEIIDDNHEKVIDTIEKTADGAVVDSMADDSADAAVTTAKGAEDAAAPISDVAADSMADDVANGLAAAATTRMADEEAPALSPSTQAEQARAPSTPAATPSKAVTVESPQPKGMGSWLWEHIYAVLGAGLGFILALLVWLLWASSRRQSRQAAAITPEMVQEKLDQIDLDLNRPRDGGGQRPS